MGMIMGLMSSTIGYVNCILENTYKKYKSNPFFWIIIAGTFFSFVFSCYISICRRTKRSYTPDKTPDNMEIKDESEGVSGRPPQWVNCHDEH